MNAGDSRQSTSAWVSGVGAESVDEVEGSERPSGGQSQAITVERAAPLVELCGIRKQFGALVALDGVDVGFMAGEVHALLGANGAGKTTLVRIMSGVMRPDGGDVRVEGHHASIRSTRDALSLGIGMVHQDYRLVSGFTVGENLHLGWEQTRPWATPKWMAENASKLCERYNVDLDPRAIVGDLSVAQQQQVAILRTLIREPRVIILDEPTAVLTPVETEGLFSMLRGIAHEGRAVVFITHKLFEALSVSERVTVLRNGRRIATMEAAGCDPRMLTQMMVGHNVESIQRPPSVRGEPVLAAQHVVALGDRGERSLDDVTITAHAGEIVGVIAVAGNGQRELAEVMTGLRRIESGTILLGNIDVSNSSPAEFIRAGVGHIPEDRMSTGVALDATVEANSVLKVVDAERFRFGPWLRRRAIRHFADDLVIGTQAVVPSIGSPIRHLSGGNIQRLLVGREVLSGKRALVAAYPTRGLDVAASDRVWRSLVQAANDGVAVLVISEDIDEVIAYGDVIAVLYRGRVAGMCSGSDATREEIGMLMVGREERERAAHVGLMGEGITR